MCKDLELNQTYCENGFMPLLLGTCHLLESPSLFLFFPLYCVRGEISFLFLTYLRIRNDLLLDKGNWIPKWHSLFCNPIVRSIFKKTIEFSTLQIKCLIEWELSIRKNVVLKPPIYSSSSLVPSILCFLVGSFKTSFFHFSK